MLSRVFLPIVTSLGGMPCLGSNIRCGTSSPASAGRAGEVDLEKLRVAKHVIGFRLMHILTVALSCQSRLGVN